MIKKLLIEWLPDTDSDFPIPEYLPGMGLG